MSTRILISVGSVSVEGELFDTACARAITRELPIETENNEWGDEFYFEVPVDISLDKSATRKVKVGDIGYWPHGKAVAIFFGPTPLSADEMPVPAGEVMLVGQIIGDAAVLRKGRGAGEILVEKV